MGMKKLFVLTALLLIAASAHAGWWYSAFSETDSVKNATETKNFKHSLAGEAEGTELKINLHLKAGEAVVKLTDPKGATRFHRTFRAGKSSIEEEFRGNRGQWQLEVQFKEATGKYTFKLVDF